MSALKFGISTCGVFANGTADWQTFAEVGADHVEISEKLPWRQSWRRRFPAAFCPSARPETAFPPRQTPAGKKPGFPGFSPSGQSGTGLFRSLRSSFFLLPKRARLWCCRALWFCFCGFIPPHTRLLFSPRSSQTRHRSRRTGPPAPVRPSGRCRCRWQWRSRTRTSRRWIQYTAWCRRG